MLSVFISLLLIVISLIYIYYGIKFKYWKNKGVEQLPAYPIFGSLYKVLTAKIHISEFFSEIYNVCKCKNLPYIGYYRGEKPVLVIRDTELIKNILVKDFLHFTDHSSLINRQVDPFGARNLFNMNGERWKEMRSKLTPTFTSGRMKAMFPLVLECSKKLDIYLHKQVHTDDLDLKDIMARYTTDVIGSCAFGVKCDSLNDPNCKFRVMGKKIFPDDFRSTLRVFLTRVIPRLAQILGLTAFNQEVIEFFRNLVTEVVKLRESENEKRNDFMQLLIEIKNYGKIVDVNGHEKISNEWTHDDITAQALVFFIAGFETSSSALTYALFELSRRPDLQIKARNHIEEVLNNYNGEISYQCLQDMTYLDLILQETLRKYPPLAILFRVCTKAYTIPNTNITIEKDNPIMIPIHAIQNDPDYFPQPEIFIPERFENNQIPYTNMPFGEGPRQCIGLRFAKMQTKLGLYSVLRNFNLEPRLKTKYPIKMSPRQFLLIPNENIFVKLLNKN